MSDSESTAAPAPHPSFGGKSIESVQQQQRGERPAYKSWRKKYRKMRAAFDATLEENKQLFKQEHKLEGTAKRLREELDGVLETLLDINQSAAVPPEMRFDVRIPAQRQRPNMVPADIDPDSADRMMEDYLQAVAQGRIPPLDLHIVREQIDERLAAQNVTPIESLEHNTPHPLIPADEDLPDECRGDSPPGYLTTEQESTYLRRLDEKHGDRLALDKADHSPVEPHPAELTPRELERHMELLNPQSQHNWLKLNTKIHTEGPIPIDDNESLASHEGGGGGKAKGGKGKGKNLAKQAAERAAYEGYMSPSAASGFDEDELAAMPEEHLAGSSKKRVRDPDGAYRVKGGKGGAAKGGKRKRTAEEGETGSVKKARITDGGVRLEEM